MKILSRRLFIIILAGAMALSSPLQIYANMLTSDGNSLILGESRNDTQEDCSADTTVGMCSDNLSVTGTDSFGRMLSDVISDKAMEQQENNGYNVFSVEMEGKTATVDLESVRSDSILVVAVYEEDGVRLLGSGKVDVKKGDNSATVVIDIDTMPQYFYVRAFLVRSSTLEPLSSVYGSPNYTMQMQEFLKKTTDDFKEELVLNLDDDKANNFMVYKDGVVRVIEQEGINTVTSADEESLTYVFSNFNDKLSGLKPGDTLSYERTDGTLILIAVSAVDISENGEYVTVKGKDSLMENIFEYIKIDVESTPDDVLVDNSNLPTGVVSEDAGTDNVLIDGAKEGESYKSKSLNYSLLENEVEDEHGNKVSLEGSIGLEFKNRLKYYVAFAYQYVELSLDYTLNGTVKFAGRLNAPIKLGEVKIITAIPGVIVEFVPKFIFEVTGSIQGSIELKGTIGGRYHSEEGFSNITKHPTFSSEIKGDFSAFIGLSLKPEVAFIYEDVLSVSLEARFGAEVKGTLKKNEKIEQNRKIHACNNCMDGETYVLVKGYFEAKFLDVGIFSGTMTVREEIQLAKIKLNDWYWSIDKGDIGFGECPNYAYKVKIRAKGKAGSPLPGVKITTSDPILKNDDGYFNTSYVTETDGDGNAVFYQPIGSYTATVKYDGLQKSISYTVTDKGADVIIVIDKTSEEEEDEDEDEDDKGYYHVLIKVTDGDGNPILGANVSFTKDIKVCENGEYKLVRVAVTDKNGEVSGSQKVGNATVTIVADGYKKIIHQYSVSEKNNVITVKMEKNSGGEEEDGDIDEEFNRGRLSLGSQHSAVIKDDGSLWMWGSNSYGQIGTGKISKYNSDKVKVMDDVAYVDLGNSSSAAIKEDGSLWTWGYNRKGGLGNGTTENTPTPTKIMDDVVNVSISDFTGAAIKKDGSLWMWGDNEYGEVGNGSSEKTILTPVMVMKNVKTVNVGGKCLALTKDGKIYKWGAFPGGGVSHISKPAYVMDNIKDLSRGGGDLMAYIKQDDSAWVFGTFSDYDKSTGSLVEIEDADKELDNVRSICCGGNSITAITKDNKMMNWGGNMHDMVGNGQSSIAYPYPIEIMDNVLISSMGGDHGAAITEDGYLWMWGGNYNNQISSSSTGIYSTPRKIMKVGIRYEQNNTSTAADLIRLDNLSVSHGLSDDERSNDIAAEIQPLSTEISDAVIEASFKSLDAYKVYNFYLLKDKKAVDPLAPTNILYIGQGMSDGNGDMTVSYIPRETTGAEGFVVRQWEYAENEIEEGDEPEEYNIPNGLWMAGIESLTFDGTSQTQDVRIYDGRKLLTEGIDYSISYKNNKNAYTLKKGDAGFDANKAPQLFIMMKGNYSGSQTVNFCIDPLSIEDEMSFDTYIKKKGKVNIPVLLWNNKALKEKTDYLVNATESGFELTGKGNFTGKRVVTDSAVAPKQISISKAKVVLPSQIYKGSPYTIDDFTKILKDKITYGNKTLVAGIDYKIVKIVNGNKAGTATVVIQGLKNEGTENPALSGEKRIKVRIIPYDLGTGEVSVTDTSDNAAISASFRKGGVEPEIKVNLDGTILRKGRDYTVKYSNNKSVNGSKKPLITIFGKGNFKGKKSIEFAIEQKKFNESAGILVLANDIVLPKNPSKYQTKIEVFDNDGTLLKAGIDYKKDIVYKKAGIPLDKSSKVAAGDIITVEITGAGTNYSGDIISTTYSVLPDGRDISKAKIKIKDQPYTGNAILITGVSQIGISVIGKSKNELKISTDGGKTGDFMVVPGSYVNNVNKGTAKVTFKGINGYGGYKTVTFKVGTRSLIDSIWYGLLKRK